MDKKEQQHIDYVKSCELEVIGYANDATSALGKAIGEKIAELYKQKELVFIEGGAGIDAPLISRGFEEWYDEELVNSNQRAMERNYWLDKFQIYDSTFDSDAQKVILFGVLSLVDVDTETHDERPAMCVLKSGWDYRMAFPAPELRKKLSQYPFHSWNWKFMKDFLKSQEKCHVKDYLWGMGKWQKNNEN